MDNARKPREKPRKPGPLPGEVYNGVADIVARLRAGILLSQEAGVPVPIDFRRALSAAIVVECQLAGAIVETN